MKLHNHAQRDGAERPRIGFVLLGGAMTGARVRDVRLLNELVRRGYQCHVWWAFEWDHDAGLDPQVPQKWLFHLARFAGYFQGMLGRQIGHSIDDFIGRCVSRLGRESLRNYVLSRYPQTVNWALRGLIREVCGGVERDSRLIRRFAKELDHAGITHVLPMLEVLALFVQAARAEMRRPARYAVTFQGYEVYSSPAREEGLERALYEQLRLTTFGSDYQPITVSRPYAERIEADIGISADDFAIIPPGVPTPECLQDGSARELLTRHFGITDFETPIVSYLGRQDSEKGVDLLLYAAKLLNDRGIRFQLIICGPTAFGAIYSTACRQIGEQLRLPVTWRGYITDDVRSALMRLSRCLVYPSIHREPFGMVPVEAMSHGTPVVVSDTGGVAELVKAGSSLGGLTFRSWDSGALANSLERLLTDDSLHRRLADDAQTVAANYSVEKMADGVLKFLGLHRSTHESARDCEPEYPGTAAGRM